MASLYSVDKSEVEQFVEENEFVRNYLNRYSRDRNRKGSYEKCAHILCRFFKWLRVVKGWDVSPEKLLDDQMRRLLSDNISDKNLHVNLVLEHSRDNSDFAELSDSRMCARATIVNRILEERSALTTQDLFVVSAIPYHAWCSC